MALMQASHPCRNMHNNLRITRILKSLGELGFRHYQAPLVRFFLEETLVKKTLSSVKRSVLDYFLFAVLDKDKRQDLVRFAYLHFEPKDKFVWCPRKIQKQFRKIEKRSDTVGAGGVDGKEEVYSRGKSKDGEAGAQQKEDGLDKVPKDQKGVTKAASKDKNASCESSPKWEEEAVGNGNAEAGSEKFLENGGDCAEEGDEMDQSPGPDTVMAKSEPESKSASGAKDTVQEADLMQTERDAEPEKPPKKKREDDAEVPAPGPGPAAGPAALEEKVGGSKPSSSSGQTPLKTSKHSPSPCQGREEKIPRTDFNQVPDKREDQESSREGVSVANGSPRSGDKEGSEQTNGKDCDDDVTMESQNSSSSQNVGDS